MPRYIIVAQSPYRYEIHERRDAIKTPSRDVPVYYGIGNLAREPFAVCSDIDDAAKLVNALNGGTS